MTPWKYCVFRFCTKAIINVQSINGNTCTAALTPVVSNTFPCSAASVRVPVVLYEYIIFPWKYCVLRFAQRQLPTTFGPMRGNTCARVRPHCDCRTHSLFKVEFRGLCSGEYQWRSWFTPYFTDSDTSHRYCWHYRAAINSVRVMSFVFCLLSVLWRIFDVAYMNE